VKLPGIRREKKNLGQRKREYIQKPRKGGEKRKKKRHRKRGTSRRKVSWVVQSLVRKYRVDQNPLENEGENTIHCRKVFDGGGGEKFS